MVLLSNLPSLACPIGLSRGGLPIVVQVMGAHLEDRTTFAFVGLLDREFCGFQAPASLI